METTIAFVEPNLNIGGKERNLYYLIRGLDKDKFRPVLCCLKGLGPWGEQLQAEGFRTYHGLIRSKSDARGIPKLAAVLKNEQASILYVTNSLLNVVVGRLAAFVARVPRSVITFQSHDVLLEPYLPFSKRTMRRMTERTLLPHFDRVIATSAAQKPSLISGKHIPERKIRLVYNCVDLSQFAHTVDRRAVRHSRQIPDGAKVVAIVAGLSPWKSHDVFLQSAAAVRKEIPNTHFVVAGDGPERSRLEQMAQTLHVAENVHFLGRVRDVPTLLMSVDLSVLSSAHESFPLALLESMAAGLPVVATSVGGVPEMVVDGVTGFLVPPGESDQLAQAMLRILRAPELGRKLGEEGRRMIVENHTVEHMVSGTESVLLELVGSMGQSLQ